MKSLQDRGQVGENGWQLSFMPISIRVGTNRPDKFLSGLAQRLADIIGEPIAHEVLQSADALKHAVRDQLAAIAEARGQRVLIVLDGLDEALRDSFDPSFIPTLLPPTLRILLSARWQVGDTDSTGWLKRLGWGRNVQAEMFELERLGDEEISDLLK
jgi:hypothetical protein